MKIKIVHDEFPESPREWDNLGKMVCLHRHYNLGDTHSFKESDFSSWNELKELLEKEEDAKVILPLYLFDHSGLSISCSSRQFRMADSAGWDWGQVGFIYATRKSILETFNCKRLSKRLLDEAKEILIGEVKVYDQYLTGDVWGFIIEDDNGEEIESCWGFFGYDNCELEAKDLVSHIEKHREERKKAVIREQAAMPCCRA